MAADDRNFRSAYYEKVGCRSVEEKKSLEILLKDRPLDKIKLKQFCLRFSVPGIYRNIIWKILLDVLPVYIDSHKFVMLQRQQEYKDLFHALKVMQLINDNTPKSHVFYLMWCLETETLNYDFQIQQENGFLKISQTLLYIFEDDVDVYWMTKGFYKFVNQYRQDIPLLISRIYYLLEREDIDLYKHLQDIGALKCLPFVEWFECCFAMVLNESSLAKIWDKVCGGSSKILVFLGIVLLTVLRRVILQSKNFEGVLLCINNITEECAEVVVNKAIELWQQHGGALTLQPDSVLISKVVK